MPRFLHTTSAYRSLRNRAMDAKLLSLTFDCFGGEMAKCVFCEIVHGKSEGTFVYCDENISVFMDTTPINTGHLLVVPNMHAAHLADLYPEIGAQMFRIAQKMAVALRKSGLRCEGINLFLADGEAAMQDVFHVHLHVIPRFRGDGFGLTLPEDYFTRPQRSELEKAAQSIRKEIERGTATNT